MIVGWSPHTGASKNTSPQAVIEYLMNHDIGKMIVAWHVGVAHNPAPELLLGVSHLTFAQLNVLRTKHRYSVATLSFAKHRYLCRSLQCRGSCFTAADQPNDRTVFRMRLCRRAKTGPAATTGGNPYAHRTARSEHPDAACRSDKRRQDKGL